MKVVLLAPTPPPRGGIAGWTERMLKAHLKNDWSIEVVDEKPNEKRGLFGEKDKRNLFDEIKRCLRIWRNLLEKVKDPEVKVVHSCIPSYATSMMREYVCAIISKLYRKRFLIHFRCTVPNSVKGGVSLFLLKRMCRISDRIILLNEQSADFVKRYTKTPIVIIPNFVDMSEIADSREINEEVRNVVYVGGVIETKGCMDIIEVAKRFPNITFTLVGNPAQTLKAAAENVSNVILTGAVDSKKVKDHLEKADVFMFLTYFLGEGFSNALAEAMAVGLPCIATDWAANKDMIANKGGFIVPIKDTEAASQALEQMQAYQVRLEQSRYNLSRVREFYAENVVLSQYVDAYESTIK